MGENVNLDLHAQIIIENIVVKIAKFRGILLWGGASKKLSNVGLYKSGFLQDDWALEMLDKQ